MPRRKDPAIEDRDRSMINQFLSGDMTVQELADREGISRQRVYQIFSRFARTDVPEEMSIDEHTIMLQNARAKFYHFVVNGPQVKVTVRGELIDGPDGEYIYELQEWSIMATVFLKIDESLRKLKARDLPRRKQLGLDEAQIEILAHIAKLQKTTVHAELVPASDDKGDGTS